MPNQPAFEYEGSCDRWEGRWVREREGACRLGLAAHPLEYELDLFLAISRVEGAAAREQHVRDDTERPHVARLGVGLALEHLGRHVRERADATPSELVARLACGARKDGGEDGV